MKKRNIIMLTIALALIAISATLGGVYAYWVGNVAAPTDQAKTVTINVGEANDITTTLVVNDPAAQTDVLVPAGKAAVSKNTAGTPVETKDFVYTVKWNEDTTNLVDESDNITKTLTVTKGDVKIDGATTYASLVNVNIVLSSSTITLDAAGEITVTVTITLTEPANKTEYEAIINKPITVDLTFSVA